MIVDIIHPDSATPKKSEVRDALAKNYKTQADHIIAFGFKARCSYYIINFNDLMEKEASY